MGVHVRFNYRFTWMRTVLFPTGKLNEIEMNIPHPESRIHRNIHDRDLI
jgi:hypothetical protein